MKITKRHISVDMWVTKCSECPFYVEEVSRGERYSYCNISASKYSGLHSGMCNSQMFHNEEDICPFSVIDTLDVKRVKVVAK